MAQEGISNVVSAKPSGGTTWIIRKVSSCLLMPGQTENGSASVLFLVMTRIKYPQQPCISIEVGQIKEEGPHYKPRISNKTVLSNPYDLPEGT